MARSWRRLPAGSRGLGIAMRLGVSFGAVAVLAIAANLIAEHGASIIQTTKTYSPVIAPAAQIERPRPALPVALPPAEPEPRPLEAPPNDADLLDAVGQFERTLVLRAQIASPENTAVLSKAAQRLEDETRAFITATAPRQGTRTKSLAAHSRAVRGTGDALVLVNDARRARFASYWSHFENVDGLMKSALDSNWKIFGRVISRQSLISLSRELDEIRRQAAQLTPAGGYDEATLISLADSERQFFTTLEQNLAGLERAHGAEWLQQLRGEFSAVVSSRTELASIDRQASQAQGTFEEDVTALAALVRVITSSARQQIAAKRPVVAAATSTPAVAKSVSAPAVAPAVVPPPSPAPLPTSRLYTKTTSTALAPPARISMAAISAVILMVLLAVSIGTVRSIVRPIRQFMATTRRLAGGDAAARFERGGIKELDSLAVSLNQMAETLEVAQATTREYQGVLEVRIDERTRQLQHLAEHDPLTGLPNRRQLLAHLTETLHAAARNGARVAVFFLDLDNFKNINDSMGHTFGDRVLQGVAHRLREATAPEGFAARLGGDEFMVVYEASEGVEHAAKQGNDLVHAFQEPLLVEGRELLISISVGGSLYPEHEDTPDALLRAADAALFQAKTLGRNQLSLFSRELLESASRKFNIEQGLRRAVERNEFELVFQPEVSFDGCDTKLVEALLRWHVPDRRHISPAQFLSVAQESGLIMRISDWVLHSAVEWAAKWHHGPWPDARVAINVSASQLLGPRFAERVQELLTLYRLPARCIEIELTENVLQTGPGTIETLRELHQLGIAIALDDFGTGFSSLASLQQLPLTRVKLDQSLIAGIDTDHRSLAIASAIIGLCDSLGFEVTAEGVERPQQLALLLEHRSMCFQGYLISHPVDGGSLPATVATMPERLQSLFLRTSSGSSGIRPVRLVTHEADSLRSGIETSKSA